MEELDFTQISGWASIIGIPLSIIIAIIQTVRLRQFKLREYRDIWQLIKQVRDLMGKTSSKENPQLAKAHENAKSIYRHLIKNAANLESSFNETKIEQWIKDDKIGDTDWQKGIAKNFIKR